MSADTVRLTPAAYEARVDEAVQAAAAVEAPTASGMVVADPHQARRLPHRKWWRWCMVGGDGALGVTHRADGLCWTRRGATACARRAVKDHLAGHLGFDLRAAEVEQTTGHVRAAAAAVTIYGGGMTLGASLAGETGITTGHVAGAAVIAAGLTVTAGTHAVRKWAQARHERRAAARRWRDGTE